MNFIPAIAPIKFKQPVNILWKGKLVKQKFYRANKYT